MISKNNPYPIQVVHYRKRIGWLFLMCISVGLVGCGTDDTELRNYMQEVKSRPSKPIEPIPEFETPEKFTYPEQQNRRSPFKQIKVVEKEDVQAPNINRPKQPLEAFPLDALKFVGIVKVNSTIWGLISQPDGLITRVKAGDYMGKNFGRITQITNDTIKLEETIQVGGKWEKRPITLKLNKPE
ncbi:pilus assembly protein PilP [Legionella impletisoli]|uniref:Pilus biosynthesis protein PilP n=1 Tax=Legionella impletisoli TaxID=343510 RepID=A0A917JYQ6_9GAMM|nr:pilus assembly protein PilP [Legionella impletisoli]GGI91138.1 pilus biosynthesis protein PilP [Legionella impletisoli]